MSPLFKSADIPHTAKFLLLRGSSSGNRFSDELAARADALALSTWPLHCNRRHLSEIAAFRFAVAAGFFSGVLVPMRPRIWLELARLGSTRQSLPLRCCVVVGPQTLRKFLGKLHMQTAKQLNLLDSTPERKVWFQFWESRITFERSYLARLNYVHHNPAQHGVVPLAEDYKWCSASWFACNAPPAFVNSVKSFKIDRVHVPDDF